MKKLLLFLLLCAMCLGSVGCVENSPQTPGSPAANANTDSISESDVSATEESNDETAATPNQMEFSLEDIEDLQSDFWTTLRELQSGKASVDNLSEFVFDDVTMHVSFEEPPIVTEEQKYACVLTGLTAAGQTVTVDPPLTLYQNRTVNLFEADGMYVFSSLFSGAGDTYILREDGVYELHNGYDLTTEEPHYNDDLIVFTKGEDGSLKYECYPRKFTGLVSVGQALNYLTDRNEQFQESGSVTFQDGQPIFTVEETRTISQSHIDLEAQFEGIKADLAKHADADYRNVQTLDELIAVNASKYEKYTCQLARE